MTGVKYVTVHRAPSRRESLPIESALPMDDSRFNMDGLPSREWQTYTPQMDQDYTEDEG